ncbi:teichoic acid translocation permease protein TagG [mine drainage metagenome]|uniref:Teichoic acid translocation permease protein TagG n=1 Tax=mine drainage metagenome TaxID=410659 RepID=A0A1J5Q4F0_9ZZZZ
MTSEPIDLTQKIQVFEPHKAALPPLGPYFRELWRRRRFALELSRFTDKAEYLDSPLGAVWLVLNPLMLAMVYYLLVTLLAGARGNKGTGSGFDTLAHILIGLFTWYFAQNCMTMGGSSVTLSGRLILNQAFPRVLLPLSSVVSAFRQFMPTLPIYMIIYVVGSRLDSKTTLTGMSWHTLWVPVIILFVALSGFGLALLFATMNVYFRDTSKILQYGGRIWLYLSPVLWLPERLHGWHRILLWANPLGPVLAMTTTVWIEGRSPSATQILASLAWAIGLVLFGGYFFISRERDFAVRV